MKNTTLVLTTVNAPYSEQLDALTLAYCLSDQNAARAKPGHMSSFFGEVDPALQVSFAEFIQYLSRRPCDRSEGVC